jgi:hypothetical protein
MDKISTLVGQLAWLTTTAATLAFLGWAWGYVKDRQASSRKS